MPGHGPHVCSLPSRAPGQAPATTTTAGPASRAWATKSAGAFGAGATVRVELDPTSPSRTTSITRASAFDYVRCTMNLLVFTLEKHGCGDYSSPAKRRIAGI